MKVDALMRKMQLESNHIAMVVDEYGGIAGLVTLEDLIEELVGDISDEYDRAVVEVEELGDGRYRVNARLPIDELGELFGLELEDDDDFVAPIAQWSTDNSSPSGIAVGPDGDVYMAALRGESLWRVPVNGPRRQGEPQRLFQGRYGRIRDVVAAPDRSLWILSSNTYRGDVRDGDDRVVRGPVG